MTDKNNVYQFPLNDKSVFRLVERSQKRRQNLIFDILDHQSKAQFFFMGVTVGCSFASCIYMAILIFTK